MDAVLQEMFSLFCVRKKERERDAGTKILQGRIISGVRVCVYIYMCMEEAEMENKRG